MNKRNNPFVGLHPFGDSTEKEYYTGYDSIGEELRDIILNNSLTLLIGLSGSGKTSFIQASFIKTLYGNWHPLAPDNWIVKKITPKDDLKKELKNLSREIKSEYGNSHPNHDVQSEVISGVDITISNFRLLNALKEKPLLIIDQFEEMYTREKSSIKDQKSFNSNIGVLYDLLDNVKNLSILLCCRSDYLQNLAAIPEFLQKLNGKTVFLPVLPDYKLQSVIDKPLRNNNQSISPELRSHLIHVVKNIRGNVGSQGKKHVEDDSLGLLQFYLFQMWNVFAGQEDEFTIKHYLQLGPFQNIIDRTCNDVYYFGRPFPELTKGNTPSLSRLEKHMTKFLFQYISKQDLFNPKKVVRNPQALEEIANLYQSVFHGNHAEKSPFEEKNKTDKRPSIKDWEDLVKRFGAIKQKAGKKRDEIKIVGILKYDDEGKIDVVHEAVFRQWVKCRNWIEEKNERFDQFTKLLDNEDLNQVDKNLPYQETMVHYSQFIYYNSTNWQVQYCNYAKIPTNEIIKNKKANRLETIPSNLNTIENALNRLLRLRFFYAIKRADFFSLYKILEHNKNKNHKIFLENDELNQQEFEKEFFYALYPEKAEFEASPDVQSKEAANPPKKTKVTGASDNTKDRKKHFEERSEEGMAELPTEVSVDKIIERWNGLRKSQHVHRFIEYSYSSPTDVAAHYNLYHFAAFAGRLEYIEAYLEFFCLNRIKYLNEENEKDPGIFVNSDRTSAFDMAIYGRQLFFEGNKYKGLAKTIFDRFKSKDKKDALLKPSSKNGRTPFHFAAMNGHHEVLDWLLDKAKENKLYKNNDYASFLLSLRDNQGDSPLHLGTYRNPRNLPGKLLTQNQILAKNDKIRGETTPLFDACIVKSDNSIREIINFAKSKDFLPALLGIEERSSKFKTSYLLATLWDVPEGFDANSNREKYIILNRLLNQSEARRNINITYKDGSSLLHNAIGNAYLWGSLSASFDIIKLLLQNGANPNSTTWEGRTPLDLAVIRGNLNIVKLFFEEPVIKNGVSESTLKKALNLALLLSFFKKEMFEISDYLLFRINDNPVLPLSYFNRLDKLGFDKSVELIKIPKTDIDITPIINTLKWEDNQTSQTSPDSLLRFIGHFWSALSGTSEPYSLSVATLPFYPNANLYEVKFKFSAEHENTDNNTKIRCLSFLEGRSENDDKFYYFALNGVSSPLHELNAKLPIRLKTANVLNYLKFFCAAVHGEEGAFKIIDKMSDVHWLDQSEKKKVKNLVQLALKFCIKPTRQIDKQGTEFWTCTALVNYSNALFLANFKVLKSGMVEMADDQPVVSGLSLNLEVFENGLRAYKEKRPEKGKNMKFSTQFIESCFLDAVMKGNLNTIQMLYDMENNFNINTTISPLRHYDANNGGKTALRIAVENQNIAIVDWLLAHPGILDLKANDGKTAFDVSKEIGNKRLIQLLKNNTRDINFRFEFDDSKWSIAAITDSAPWEIYNKDMSQKFADKHINFLSRIKHLLPEKPIFQGVRVTTLPFYPNVNLFEVKIQFGTAHENSKSEAKTGYLSFFEVAFENSDQFHLELDGSSTNIHKLNAGLPIQIADDNVYAYLKFFCSAIHGNDGAFKIIDKVNTIHWLEQAEKKKVKNLIQLALKSCKKPIPQHDEQGNLSWMCTTLINYSNAIFLADFKIMKSGKVEMANDQHIISGLSINLEVFENGVRTYREKRPEPGEEMEIISFTQAASAGLLDIMKWMVNQNKELDINMLTKQPETKETEVTDVYGKSALRLAVENSQIHVVKWLLGLNGITDKKAMDGKNAEDIARKNKSDDMLALFEYHKKKA